MRAHWLLAPAFAVTLALASAPVPALAQAGAAATSSLSADIIKDWTAQKDQMMKIADAMPEDKFGFKPTPAQRNFGEQVMHVAGANVTFMKLLGAKAVAPELPKSPTAKADILKALSDSFDYGIAALKEQTDTSLQQVVKGPAFMGDSTRVRLAWFLYGHTLDTYGQMVVYLRLNGIVPPASRGV